MQTISIPALAEATGGARDAQVRETWLGGVRLGVARAQPRAQPPRVALSKGGVAVRPDAELWAP